MRKGLETKEVWPVGMQVSLVIHKKYNIIFEDQISKDNVARSTVEVLSLSFSLI